MTASFSEEERRYRNKWLTKFTTGTMNKLLALNSKITDLAHHVKRGRITQAQADFIIKINDICTETLTEDFDIQFDWLPIFRVETNPYGIANVNNSFYYPDGFLLNSFYIIIHYPEITIKNSKQESRLLKDMFIRLKFAAGLLEREEDDDHNGQECFRLDHPYGVRTTFSILEYNNNYHHSHLSHEFLISGRDQKRLDFTGFCTGSSDFKATEMLINEGINDCNPIDEDLFMLYLMQVKNFISWESLDGGPFIKMEGLTVNREPVPIITDRDGRIVGYDMVSVMSKNNNFANTVKLLKWRVTNPRLGEAKIVDDENYEEFLRETLYKYYSNCFYLKDTRGNYHPPGRLSIPSARNFPTAWLPFKNQKINLKVYLNDEELNITNISFKTYLHPQYKKYVKHKLESLYEKAKVRQSGIKRLHQSKYPR